MASAIRRRDRANTARSTGGLLMSTRMGMRTRIKEVVGAFLFYYRRLLFDRAHARLAEIGIYCTTRRSIPYARHNYTLCCWGAVSDWCGFARARTCGQPVRRSQSWDMRSRELPRSGSLSRVRRVRCALRGWMHQNQHHKKIKRCHEEDEHHNNHDNNNNHTK